MLCALVLSLCLAHGVPAESAIRDQVILIPVYGSDGGLVELRTRLCRPASDAPAHLVIINHRSPVLASERPLMQPRGCANPNYVRAGLETARDISAVVEYLTTQP